MGRTGSKMSVYCVTSLDIGYKDCRKPLFRLVYRLVGHISAPLLFGIFYGTCMENNITAILFNTGE